MKTNNFFSVLFIITVILTPPWSGDAFALTRPAGRVVAIRGEAHAFGKNGHDRLLKTKFPIFIHDTIVTGKRARLQLLFEDSSMISVGSNSKMILAKYAWDKKSGKGYDGK